MYTVYTYSTPDPVFLGTGSAGMSPGAAARAREALERERAELLNKTGLAEEERDTAKLELERRENELLKAQWVILSFSLISLPHPLLLLSTSHNHPSPSHREQHAEMEQKLKDLSSKVIVGGVNLLERAEHQQQLLEQSAREMAKRKKKEAKLTKQLRK